LAKRGRLAEQLWIFETPPQPYPMNVSLSVGWGFRCPTLFQMLIPQPKSKTCLILFYEVICHSFNVGAEKPAMPRKTLEAKYAGN
ncbi:MAG: hypothetical protein WD625_10805, partial [Balneolales bacterium]